MSIASLTYEEIKIGDSASTTRTLTKKDTQLFAIVSGDMNPAHLDEEYAKTDIFHQVVGHGMWTGSLFSSLLGMQLPGLGTIYVSQNLKFLKPVFIGDTITASVTVTGKEEKHKHINLDTVCINAKGEKILEGTATVIPPPKRIVWHASPIPEVIIQNQGYDYKEWLLAKTKDLKPLKTAIVHPVDALSLEGAVEAAMQGIIEPILVGNAEKIKATAAESGLDISAYQIISTEHSHAAAAVAVELARNGKVEALMKGKLHTDELMEAVIDKELGLRTGRRISHVFMLDVPTYPKPLFLTDAAININPDLMEKKDIVQNAIDLFQAIGLGTPKVAILAAVETVNENMPATLDATALCKMAERGQITGAIIDGPLAFDNAISKEAALVKGITSPVAGEADILVVPDIESGNMLYKQLRYFSGVQGAGIVLGAKVPVILTSRASGTEDRVISCSLALLYAQTKR